MSCGLWVTVNEFSLINGEWENMKKHDFGGETGSPSSFMFWILLFSNTNQKNSESKSYDVLTVDYREGLCHAIVLPILIKILKMLFKTVGKESRPIRYPF